MAPARAKELFRERRSPDTSCSVRAGARRPALLAAYRTMRTNGDFEERLREELATGDIPGFVRLYAGEEG
ncbi:hypothetical protein GCM10010277_46360 [Streptomyces longisporoflavus]|nr:hypothetical protein GCM10010277_46360 [Streptomyces longisporoflavus]